MSRSLHFLVLIAIFALVPSTCRAQCVYQKISVSRVQGAVFDRSGQPIPDADVNLKKDGQVVATTKTDGAGRFLVGTSPGAYDLNESARNLAPGFARIDVGIDLVRIFKSTRLWMILDVGMRLDACTFISTSHRQLEKANQENTR
jgi:hypothetical protein